MGIEGPNDLIIIAQVEIQCANPLSLAVQPYIDNTALLQRNADFPCCAGKSATQLQAGCFCAFLSGDERAQNDHQHR